MKKLKTILATVAALAILVGGCTGVQKRHATEQVPVFNVYEIVEDVTTYDQIFDYIEDKGIKHFIIDIHNPGANAFSLIYVLERMNRLKEQGVIIETHVEAMALSGGFIIFVNGTKGYRKVNKNAVLMTHTLQKMGPWGPSPVTEANAKTPGRALLNAYLEYFIAGTGLSYKRAKQILFSGKDIWITGQGMLERGWADEEL
jgi:ATP-dependent protease ClpP protease subunit